ncbi:MAG: hypothetical protein ACREEW_12815 [Caulobacteraceae bacterium]
MIETDDDRNGLRVLAGSRVYPYVLAYVEKNFENARLLSAIIGHGATAFEVLAVAGEETGYGRSDPARRYGNYFGLHSRRDGPSHYFPGQQGIEPRGKKPPLATYDPASGFYYSGLQFATRLRGVEATLDLANPATFFSLAHKHGWGHGNPTYMKDVESVYLNVLRAARAASLK